MKTTQDEVTTKVSGAEKQFEEARNREDVHSQINSVNMALDKAHAMEQIYSIYGIDGPDRFQQLKNVLKELKSRHKKATKVEWPKTTKSEAIKKAGRLFYYGLLLLDCIIEAENDAINESNIMEEKYQKIRKLRIVITTIGYGQFKSKGLEKMYHQYVDDKTEVRPPLFLTLKEKQMWKLMDKYI